MKKIISIICAAALLLALAPSALSEGKMENYKYGLHIENGGEITLEGKPFYGYGVNYFGAFVRYAEQKENCQKDFINGLAGLASYNIPFIRMPLCAYYPSYYDFFDSDPEKVFSYMDEVLEECRKNNIGVIVSLMWWDAVVAAHVGGKRSDMGVIGSDTLNYAKAYTRAIVQRYVSHPAVWGWEIGNEYNLDADLCDKELKQFLWPEGIDSMPLDNVNGYDYYTSEELRTFYTEIAKVIREYDDYRMITTGNGEMRPFAYIIHKSSLKAGEDHLWDMKWNGNTRKQFDYMNEYMTPDPIDTVCFHFQNAATDYSKQYVLTHNVFGKTISSEEYFRAYYETAKNLGKGCFFGEFGDMLAMENEPDMMDKFKEVTDAISNSGIQIAALWQFQDYTDEGPAGLKLAYLSELNKKLVSDGKQQTEEAWKEREEITETEAETESDTVTEAATQEVTLKPDDDEKTEKKTNVTPYIIAGVAAAAICAAVIVIIKKKKKK